MPGKNRSTMQIADTFISDWTCQLLDDSEQSLRCSAEVAAVNLTTHDCPERC